MQLNSISSPRAHPESEQAQQRAQEPMAQVPSVLPDPIYFLVDQETSVVDRVMILDLFEGKMMGYFSPESMIKLGCTCKKYYDLVPKLMKPLQTPIGKLID